MIRIAVLVSGRGSNLAALLRWQQARALGGEIVLVASNRSSAPALGVAREHGIETYVLGDGSGRVSAAAQEELSRVLESRDVDLTVLAGYDRILAPAFVQRWAGRMMNVHPSLLPAFGGGLHAQRDALEHGVKITGCTVHLVSDDVDGGPIVAQAAVPVLPEDDEHTLSQRILEQEHHLLPAAVRAFAEGRLVVQGRRVFTRGE